jgi:hypothetical protein
MRHRRRGGDDRKGRRTCERVRATDEVAFGGNGHAGAVETKRSAANSTHVVVSSAGGNTEFAAKQHFVSAAAFAESQGKKWTCESACL